MPKGLSGDNFLNTMMALVDSNNNLSMESADRANRFTEHLQDRAESFNASEAEKNRAFQLEQRNTAHQAEVRDLIRAGLNPVLSANNGASVTSGATASVGSGSGTKADIDMQKASLYAQYKLNQINNAQALKINALNNQNALEMARIGAAASMYGADASAAASRFAALQSAGAAIYGYNKQFEASKYNTDETQKTSIKNNRLNNFVNFANSWQDRAVSRRGQNYGLYGTAISAAGNMVSSGINAYGRRQ